ncbi:MAG: cellulase family glycosylhydrolase [Acidimicrobiales bacterium]
MKPATARSLAIGAIVALCVASSCTGSGTDASSGRSTTTTTPRRAVASLPALHAERGEHPRIVDTAGRQVILRGVNLNSLGDYYQGDPSAPTVVPVTDRDWADMAAHGFDVVRLLVSWSSLEPERGTFDRTYLRRVHDAVDAAAAHGIYSVIDMHQDAWGAHVASPADETCPGGGDPAIGWDGAPAWATLDDGASTCTHGSRESSEAVMTDWDSFYANRDGIMDELVATWSFVATEFAGVDAVAGYDLLNEPNTGHHDTTADLGRFYDRAIDAIRSAEATAAPTPGGAGHIAFFETTVSGQPVPTDFTTDTNIVFAPHNYGESIGPIPIEGTFDYFRALAAGYGTAMWVGEYGFFEDTDAAEAKLTRYAAKEDALLTAGDAWWQWRQACGDPHSVGHPGGTSGPIQVHMRTNRCPGDRDGGVNPRWRCTWRAYPRFAPGVLSALASPCEGGLVAAGHTDRPGVLDVWAPGTATTASMVTGDHLSDVHVTRAPGGVRITATVDGDYTLRVAGP